MKTTVRILSLEQYYCLLRIHNPEFYIMLMDLKYKFHYTHSNSFLKLDDLFSV